jgi:hypothetical protein
MGFFRKVEDEVKDVGRKIDDEILQPVKNTVEAIVEDPKKLAAVALAVAFPGAGAALGSALGLGTGVAAQVVGQALINTALNGGDVKAAVISAALPVVGSQVAGEVGKALASTGLDQTVNTVITRAVTQGATAAVLGKDPLAAFVMGGVTAGVNAIVPDIPGYSDLPPAAKNAVNSAIAAKLTGKDAGGAISQSLVNDAISWAKTEVADLKNSAIVKQLSASGMQEGELTAQQAAQLRAELGLPPEPGNATGSQYAQALPLPISDAGGGTAAQRLGSAFASNDPRFAAIASKAPSLRAAFDEYTNTYGLGTGGDASYISELQKAWQDPASTTEDKDIFEAEINKLLAKNPSLSQFVSGDSATPTPEVTILGKRMTPEEKAEFDRLNSAQSGAAGQPGLDTYFSQAALEYLLSKPSASSSAASSGVASTANVTPAQVEKIVSDAIKANPGLTAADVQRIVSDAITMVPNLTADQVRQIVSAEVSTLPAGATPSDVQKAVDAAKADLTKAVEKVAAGAASGNADLQKSIEALKAAGLTATDVQKAVDASSANQSANTKQAIADATRGLATSAALEKTRNDLAIEIQAAKDIGLAGDAALQAGLNSLSEKMGVNQAEVLKQLGTTAAGLKTQFASEISGVKTELAQTERDILARVATNEAVGLSRDAALQKAIGDVAATQKTDAASLLSKLGTTEAALKSQVAGLGAAMTTQYSTLSAAQKATADALVAQGKTMQQAIQQVQAQAAGQIGALSADLQVKYDALTEAQRVEAAARVAQGQNLQDAISGVSGQVSGLGTQLTAQGEAFAKQLMQQGMDYKTALQTAIDAQTAVFGTQIGGVQSQIAAAEAARQADVAAQIQREQAAAAEAARQGKVADIRSTLSRGQQTLQQAASQLPQAYQQAQQVSTPIYGEMGPYLDIGQDLDFGFFKPSPEKLAATKQQQPTKIATGGYIDDLLAGDMSVDELLNLLR